MFKLHLDYDAATVLYFIPQCFKCLILIDQKVLTIVFGNSSYDNSVVKFTDFILKHWNVLKNVWYHWYDEIFIEIYLTFLSLQCQG